MKTKFLCALVLVVLIRVSSYSQSYNCIDTSALSLSLQTTGNTGGNQSQTLYESSNGWFLPASGTIRILIVCVGLNKFG